MLVRCWTGRYATSGHLLLSGPRGVSRAVRPGSVPAVNPQTFLVDDVLGTIAWSDSWFSTSETGTLVYVPGDFLLGTLAWVDRDGRVDARLRQARGVSRTRPLPRR